MAKARQVINGMSKYFNLWSRAWNGYRNMQVFNQTISIDRCLENCCRLL